MKMMLELGAFSETLVAAIDAKVAAWHALLPMSKKDPLRLDGSVDEVMWSAHLSAAMSVTHSLSLPVSEHNPLTSHSAS